jgi:hypothetical protein
MTYIYEEKSEFSIVICTDENGNISFIPMNESNSDYQRYLKWLENPETENKPTL